MASPRTSYRVGVVVLPFAALLAVLSAADGRWLSAGCGALIIASLLVTLMMHRRRGIGWNTQESFAEIRRREAQESK